jgi:hypothetical protein
MNHDQRWATAALSIVNPTSIYIKEVAGYFHVLSVAREANCVNG